MQARWWRTLSAADAVITVVVTTVVGLVTNVVTGDEPAAWLTAALVAAILVLAGLALWRVREQARTARAARDRVLTPLNGGPKPTSPIGGPPTSSDLMAWLSPVHCPTRMWARDAERRALLEWCLDDAASSWITVVSGADGAGKKRLAIEVARALPVTWHSGQAVAAAGVAEAIENCGEPCLVVVTDADRCPGIAELIRSLAGVRTTIRLLLCSCDPDLLSTVDGLPDTLLPLLADAPIVRLGPIGDEQDRIRWFNEAVRAYAAAWRTPPPPAAMTPVGDDDDGIVALLCRAMLAVLDQAGSRAARSVSLSDLMDALWRTQVAQWVADPDPRLPATARGEAALAEVVSALTLHPAAIALGVLPRFATTSSDVLAGIVDWAHDRLPLTPDGRVDPQPRLLAGHLVLTTLGREPALAAPARNDADTAADVATALARALSGHPAHLAVVIDALRGNRTHRTAMISALLTYALATPELDAALADFIPSPAPPELLHLPIPAQYPDTRCAQLTALVHDIRRRDNRAAELAAALVELACLQAELSRHAAAVAAGTEAVTLYRKLAKRAPDVHEPLLAGALYDLGTHLWRAGKHRKALRFAGEATTRYRRLVAASAQRHTSGLANALHSLAKCRADTGDPHGALRAAKEGVALRRIAVSWNSEAELPNLATDLMSLGIRLWELGLHTEAFTTGEETVQLYRTLADQHRNNKYQAELACATTNLAICHGELRRVRDAAKLSEAAVRIWQTSVPNTHSESDRRNVANSYITLANWLLNVGRLSEAVTAAEKAVMLRRCLARRNPNRHDPELARDLALLGGLYARAGKPSAGRKLTEDAVARYRALVANNNRNRHKPGLSEALDYLSDCADAQGEYDIAVAALTEAIAVERELADRNPGRHVPRLAIRLQNLAATRTNLSDIPGAIAALRECTNLLRHYAEADPEQPIAVLYRETTNQLRRVEMTWTPSATNAFTTVTLR